MGNYVQAQYNQASSDGMGKWLLITTVGGRTGDLVRVDLSSFTQMLTNGRRVNTVQWSPNGIYAEYFDTVTAGIGTLHVINTLTGVDTVVATKVSATPLPVWSNDSHSLAYSTGTHIFTVNIQTHKSLLLTAQGSVSAFAWSITNTQQMVVAIGDGKSGIYLVDTQNNTWTKLDNANVLGPIQWTQIP